MAQQTAVEWLALRYHHRQGYLTQEDIAEAKEMEKEQIIDAYDSGEANDYRINFITNFENDVSPEQYYRDTYGK